MKAHRVETIVSGDGSVTIRNVPFSGGEEVEVIILPRPHRNVEGGDRYPLRGSVRRYDRPFEPAVEPNEWDAA